MSPGLGQKVSEKVENFPGLTRKLSILDPGAVCATGPEGTLTPASTLLGWDHVSIYQLKSSGPEQE